MKLAEARAECERWLAYLASQQAKSLALQKLASDRRAHTCDDVEMRRRLSAIDRGVTVYDGAKLADAVRVMLRHTSGETA